MLAFLLPRKGLIMEKQINIKMSEKLLDKIVEHCEKYGTTISGVIRVAVEEYIDNFGKRE